MGDFSIGDIFGGGFDTGYLDDFDIKAPTNFDFEPISFLYDGSTPDYVSSVDWGDLGSFGGGTTFADMYSDSKSKGIDWGDLLGKAIETAPALTEAFSSSGSKDNPSPQANLDSAVKSLGKSSTPTTLATENRFPMGPDNKVVVDKPKTFILPDSANLSFDDIQDLAYSGIPGAFQGAYRARPTSGEFGIDDIAKMGMSAVGEGLKDKALYAINPVLGAVDDFYPGGIPGAFKDGSKAINSIAKPISKGIKSVVDPVQDFLGSIFG